jgi:protein-glutamine gamma-glutamyltransferase
MARTALVYALPALLVATGWLRLEDGGRGGEALGIALLALAPALVRPWWARGLAALVAAFVAVRLAFGMSILSARTREEEREFFAALASAFWTGTSQYFERSQPFPPDGYPLMHAVLLVTVFGFCLALGLAIASRRPVLAAVILVAGAAWPATLVSGNDLLRGAFLLTSVLLLLAAGGPRAPRLARPAVAAGVALLVAGVAAGAQPAVAKEQFLDWKTWEFTQEPPAPVGVRYVWDANYGGIEFPAEKTTVLTIRGPERGHYWRASTLETFAGDRWTADRDVFLRSGRQVDLSADTLLPQQGRREESWTRSTVRVEALRDDHLVMPGMAVHVDPGDLGIVEYRGGGVAVVPQGLQHGQRYTVWSYVPEPTPEELSAATPRPSGPRFRRNAQERYLEIIPRVPAPAFGEGAREERLEQLFTTQLRSRSLAPYRALYREARRVVGNPQSPYAAAIALEAWFRNGGGFTYDEQPPPAPDGRPPLLHFTLDSKRGYCQHYAGAMALMLRYLGIPARVAVGFTSGTYNEERERWEISNHDAHAWVEVWFEGWGWIPFDPTPARGSLPGTHSSSNPEFPSAMVSSLLRGAGAAGVATGALSNVQSDRRISADGNPFRGDIPGDWGAAGTPAAGSERRDSLIRLILLLVTAGVLLVAVSKTALRRARYATRDPRKLAAACRSELVDILLDQGVRVSRSATLTELADLAQSHLLVDADRFAHAAARARFARADDARLAAREARRELAAIRRRLRRRLSAGRRLRGLLSVRSLGFSG